MVCKMGYCPHSTVNEEYMTEHDITENRNFICANRSIGPHRVVDKAGAFYRSCDLCRASMCKMCAYTRHTWSHRSKPIWN
jgi:hypothetical protein